MSSPKKIKEGSITDKGVVEKIVYLTFNNNNTGYYTNEPVKGGKGLVCAKIGNKNIPVGELKLLNPEAERLRQQILDILRECQYDFDYGYSKAVGILNVRMVDRNKASYKLLELCVKEIIEELSLYGLETVKHRKYWNKVLESTVTPNNRQPQ